MNKIPISLWKAVVRTKKNRALWQTCKDLGKDPGPEDPQWNLEGISCYETPLRMYQFWDHNTVECQFQSIKTLHCSICWAKEPGRQIHEANFRFYEGEQPILVISFLNPEEGLALAPWFEAWQKLSRCSKVRVPFTGKVSQVFNQGHSEFSMFSAERMERIIRVYQACSPVTLWFIEEMARFLHEKAKTKTIANPEPSINR